MFTDLLHSSYFSLFLIVALGFMLGRVKIKGLSLDVSAVIFIALLFGHFGVIIPKELGNFGLVLFIFTIGIQAGPGFFDSFRSKGKTLILITMLIICSACLTAVGLKYAFDIDTPSVVGLIAGALTSTPGLAVAIDSTHSPLASIAYGIAYPFGVIGVILFVKLLPKIMRVDRMKKMKADPHYNALQVKYAYAVTCHKAQGGQWQNVFLDQGYMTDEYLTPDYFRWLYTAFTRATKTLYLVNYPKEQVE